MYLSHIKQQNSLKGCFLTFRFQNTCEETRRHDSLTQLSCNKHKNQIQQDKRFSAQCKTAFELQRKVKLHP